MGELPVSNDCETGPVLDTSNNDSAHMLDDEKAEEIDETLYVGMDEKEKKECEYNMSYLENVVSNKKIFSTEGTKVLKDCKKSVTNRNEMSYYCCKKDPHRCITK